MKKMLVAVAALAFAMSASAQTNQVLSRNAVGYQRFELQKGVLYMIRPDFFAMTGSLSTVKAAAMFGNQLPNGTTINFFDPLALPTPGYVQDSRSAFGVWGTSINFKPGHGFWVKIPSTAVSNSYVLYLMGEVPDSLNLAALNSGPTNQVVAVYPGLNQLGYSFPVSVAWTNTHLAKISKTGDKVITWDAATTGYLQSSRSAFGAWANAPTLTPGQAFFYLNTNTVATNWIEPKPYTWPK